MNRNNFNCLLNFVLFYSVATGGRNALLAAASDHTECKGINLPSDFDASDWPEMWRLKADIDDVRDKPNRRDGDSAVDPSVLARAGVQHWKVDPSGYDYPAKAIPWNDTVLDPELARLRDEYEYNYADIISVTAWVDSFWGEHFHADSTIRYMVNGTGYFDLRAVDGDWVRIAVGSGDFFQWPAGIYHRFTIDEGAFITAMRLFRGSPVWTSYPRAEVGGNHSTRQEYINTYLCGVDPDAEEGDGDNVIGKKGKKSHKMSKRSKKAGKEEKAGNRRSRHLLRGDM